ncbi:MAG TPA: response regulator transcription factor [Solirubrobacteraceae bacterium]|jgi:DNA-binding response OmpR family regulator|nr:response regulator transcription factor [Solirubrobacteraceae bacterium]
MGARVLVIEDDERISLLLAALLKRAGHAVDRAHEGRGGLRQVHETNPDLVLLDVGLPELDGWDVLDRLRDISEVPVLMLTARNQSIDKVRGLRGGADDYVTKPFDPGELLARVEALLRRRRGADAQPPPVQIDGPLRIDSASRTVHLGDDEIALTPIEFRLLLALFRHRGQILSPEQLLDLAWGDSSGVSPDRVKFSIHRLRRKLGWDAEDSPIEAVRGFGYRYRKGR